MDPLEEVLNIMRLQEDALTVVAMGGCVNTEVASTLTLLAITLKENRKRLSCIYEAMPEREY